jgi:hypothetical protein
MTVFDDLRALEEEQETLGAQAVRARPRQRRICRRSPSASTTPKSEFRARDGYAIEAQVGMVLSGLGFRSAIGSAHRRVLRRLADAHRAGQAAARRAQPAAARRAHQPPRSRSAQLAGGYLESYPNAFVLISHDRYFLDVTVSQDRRNLEQARLVSTPAATRNTSSRRPSAARSSSRLRQSARPHRAARSLHQPLPRPGHQGETGAEPHQGTGKDRAHRNPARREDHPLPLSRSPSPAAASWPSSRTWPRATAITHVFSGARIQHRARRPRGAGGRQRRGQIDAHQDPGRRGAGHLRRIRPGHNASRITSRRISTRSSTCESRHAGRSGQSRRAPPTPNCAASSAAFCSPKTMSSSASACSPAASAIATRWPAC